MWQWQSAIGGGAGGGQVGEGRPAKSLQRFFGTKKSERPVQVLGHVALEVVAFVVLTLVLCSQISAFDFSLSSRFPTLESRCLAWELEATV